MLKDRILAGTIAGMTSALIKNIPNILLWKLGIIKVTYITLASAALVSVRDSATILGWTIGTMVDIITGGTGGLLIIFLLKFTGRDYWWYKGLIAGNVIWLFGLGLAINFGASRIVPLDPVFRITSLIDHQIFGFVGAYLITKWYPEPGNQKELGKVVRVALRRQLFPAPAMKKKQKKTHVRLVRPKKI